MSVNPKTLIETGIKLFSIDEPPPPQLTTKIENKNEKIYLIEIFLFIELKNINKKKRL